MKILSVVGARPNFMKIGPLIQAIRSHNQSDANRIAHVLVHTGQHFDKLMSDSFFADLDLPAPDIRLELAGAGTHAQQTAEIMQKFEAVLLSERPDVVVVVGDVNSTIACALVAAKLTFPDGARPLIAHVEAGLRSFDRSMPEEINRVLTDQLSDLLFVTEQSGLHNLAREGVSPEKVHLVGNTMIDSLLAYKDRADASQILGDLRLRGEAGTVTSYALLTLHRPANVDTRAGLCRILEGVEDLGRDHCIIFPVHPRTRNRIAEFELKHAFREVSDGRPGIHAIDPLGYLDFVCLMKNARLVVTDSGGIQEETTCLGIPCVTVRENTERPVTLTQGTNMLAGVQADGIRRAVRQQLECSCAFGMPEKWDGKAAQRIVRILCEAGAPIEREVAAS